MEPVTIGLAGPAKNALGTEMMRWLGGRLREAGGAPVLLTGSGDAFCAGLDLKEILSLDATRMRTFLEDLDAVVEALYHYPGPVVGAINGHAIAGGCVLALCCDHTVMTDEPRARIGLNEVALGLQFPPNILEVVRATIPERSRDQVILGAALHGPAAACSLGLVDEVSSEAREVARARLGALAALPSAAYAAAKRGLRGRLVYQSLSEHEGFLAEVLPVWTSPDLRARIQAVLRR